jgi:hypothetical protein
MKALPRGDAVSKHNPRKKLSMSLFVSAAVRGLVARRAPCSQPSQRLMRISGTMHEHHPLRAGD